MENPGELCVGNLIFNSIQGCFLFVMDKYILVRMNRISDREFCI